MSDLNLKSEPGDFLPVASEPLTMASGAAARTAVGYVVSVAMTAVATLVAIGLDSGIAIPNSSLVFVVPVIVAAVYFSLGASLCSAVLGALSYNLFFTEPRYTLMVDDPSNVWAIALLFLVGIIVSTVAFTARRRTADVAVLREQLTSLQRYGREISAARDRNSAVVITTRTLASVFHVPAVAMVIDGGEIADIKAVGGIQPQEAEFDAARTSLEMGAAARARTFPATDSRFDFWPVGPTVGQAAVIGLAFGSDNRPSQQDELVDIVRSGLAQALDRFHLDDGGGS